MFICVICGSLFFFAFVAKAQTPGMGDDVRVVAEAAPLRVYVGQRVTLTYRLVRNQEPFVTPVRDVRLVEAPTFTSFWASELESTSPPEEAHASAAPLRSYRLFPLAAGRLEIGPPAFTMLVYPTSIETIDSEPAQVVRRADPIAIEVSPLPAAGRPDTFGGAVGVFTVAARVADPAARAGQATRIEVTVTGNGNLETTGPPRLAPVDGARVFDAHRVSVDLGLDDPNAAARAVWTIDVIPERAGLLALGPVSLDYFDPVATAYRITRSEPLAVTVAAAPPPAPPPSVTTSSGVGLGVWLLGGALGAVALAFALMAARAVRRRPEPRPRPVSAAIESPAPDPAETARLRARLSRIAVEAEEARRAGDARKMHARLLEGLGDLMSVRFGVPPGELSRERIVSRLTDEGLPAPVVDRVARLYQHCVEAGFAPQAPPADRATVEAAGRIFEALVAHDPSQGARPTRRSISR